MSSFQSPEAAAEQPAVASAKRADKSVLAKGCAIGCGVLIVLGIFGGIGGYFVYQSFMDKMGVALSAQLAEEFEVMKDSGRVPEEHAALYGELIELAQRPGTTFAGSLLIATVVRSNLDDGQVDSEERQEAEDTRDFLQENPEAGLIALNGFMKTHPGLEDRMKQIQQTLNPVTLLGPKPQ